MLDPREFEVMMAAPPSPPMSPATSEIPAIMATNGPVCIFVTHAIFGFFVFCLRFLGTALRGI
jgi:hypothetical protein